MRLLRPAFASAALVLSNVLVACGGAPAPAQGPATAAELTSAGPAATRMTNATGRPDAEIAPLVRGALERKVTGAAAARFALVPVLEPPTSIAGSLSCSVRLEIRSRTDDSVVGAIRKTVAKPGAAVGDHAAEDELITRALELAAEDYVAHGDAFSAR